MQNQTGEGASSASSLVVKFLPTTIPSWDLTLVLDALTHPTFELLQSAGLKVLSLKTRLLLVLLLSSGLGI